MFVPVVPVIARPRKCPFCGHQLGEQKVEHCPSCRNPVPPDQQTKPAAALIIGLLILLLGGVFFFYRAQGGDMPMESGQMIPIVGGLVVLVAVVALLFSCRR